MNLPVILLLAAGGYFVFNKYMNVNTFAKTVDYTITPKNFKINGFDIKFELEITILNPSNLSLTVTNPLVQIYFNGSQLTRSNFNIPALSVKPLSQSTLPPFQFTINILSSWFTLKKMLETMLKGVIFTNYAKAQEIFSKNQKEFFKLLTVQLTAYHNGTPFTKTINLG